MNKFSAGEESQSVKCNLILNKFPFTQCTKFQWLDDEWMDGWMDGRTDGPALVHYWNSICFHVWKCKNVKFHSQYYIRPLKILIQFNVDILFCWIFRYFLGMKQKFIALFLLPPPARNIARKYFTMLFFIIIWMWIWIGLKWIMLRFFSICLLCIIGRCQSKNNLRLIWINSIPAIFLSLATKLICQLVRHSLFHFSILFIQLMLVGSVCSAPNDDDHWCWCLDEQAWQKKILSIN